jgi:hypothetical protein
MAIGDEKRRSERRPLLVDFGSDVDAALDVLSMLDLAWHDCYGEVEPPQRVLKDAILVSKGDMALLARAAYLAVIDFRDLRLAAEKLD